MRHMSSQESPETLMDLLPMIPFQDISAIQLGLGTHIYASYACPPPSHALWAVQCYTVRARVRVRCVRISRTEFRVTVTVTVTVSVRVRVKVTVKVKVKVRVRVKPGTDSSGSQLLAAASSFHLESRSGLGWGFGLRTGLFGSRCGRTEMQNSLC